MNFEKIKVLIDEAGKKYQIPSSDIAISVNGKEIYRYYSAGLSGEELYFLYSLSKPITCTAALQLCERGLLNVDDKVSKYLPEYEHMTVQTGESISEARNELKIFHLFTMTSGMNYGIGSPEIKTQLALKPDSDTRELVRVMAKSPLHFEPGTHFMYGLSHDVLAAVIEVVSGMSFGEYLQKNIFDVCGMEHTYVGHGSGEEKICSLYRYDAEKKENNLIEKKNSFILSPCYQSGGAGLVSCVDDYMKFANAMVNGERLLKRSTIDRMRADCLCEQAYHDFQRVKPGYSYGMGVRTNVNSTFSVKGEFGWDGAAGSYLLMDPDNHLAVIYATHILDRGEELYEVLHPAIRDAVYEELEKGMIQKA